jgi:hypothetical protein
MVACPEQLEWRGGGGSLERAFTPTSQRLSWSAGMGVWAWRLERESTTSLAACPDQLELIEEGVCERVFTLQHVLVDWNCGMVRRGH